MTDAFGHYDIEGIAYVLEREELEQAMQREAERALAWAQHVADALLIVEED